MIRSLDLSVEAGETIALLGPSGSGKSTLLYAIAGFLEPQAGEISIGGSMVARRGFSDPPERRSVGMVFQHYALWPHMTALETVAYPLRRRQTGRPAVSPAAARTEARGLLDRMGIAHLAGRRPAELSGGEQQRIGLARALARHADLYLFDEPTAHLDIPLRAALQAELVEQRSLTGSAAVYATHDVTEALAVADRVAVLREGRLVQVNTPTVIYEQPADRWVAALTGAASLLVAESVSVTADRWVLNVFDRLVHLPPIAPVGQPLEGPILVRPNWAALDGPLPGRVASVRYRGWYTEYGLETPAGFVTIAERGAPRHGSGTPVGWRIERAWPLPPG